MTISYFDSSALVKKYVHENGSKWIRDKVSSVSTGNIIVVSNIAHVEVVATIARRLGNSGRQAINVFKYDIAELFENYYVEKIHLKDAMEISEKHRIRGYDAIHLAMACKYNSTLKSLPSPSQSIIFVSADNDLNNAAASESLLVENPENYPDPQD